MYEPKMNKVHSNTSTYQLPSDHLVVIIIIT